MSTPKRLSGSSVDEGENDYAKMLLNRDKRYQDAALKALRAAARYLVKAHDLQRAVWVLQLAREIVSERIRMVDGLLKQDRERDFAREAFDITVAAWDREGVSPEERARRWADFESRLPAKLADDFDASRAEGKE